MSDRKKIGVQVDADTWASFREFVESQTGRTRGVLGEHLERAMNQYMADAQGDDQLTRIEHDLATVKAQLAEVESDGGAVADPPAHTFDDTDHTHTDRDESKSVIDDDVPDEAPHPKASRAKKAAWIASEVDVSGEIHADKDVGSVVDDTYGFGGRSREKLVDAVLNRINVVDNPRPNAPDAFYATPERAEDIREELRDDAEDEYEEENESLEQSELVTDGGVELSHAVTALATVRHYATYREADAIPVEQGRSPSLVEFDYNNMAHLSYRCECGEAFLKPGLAAEHIKEQRDALDDAEKGDPL